MIQVYDCLRSVLAWCLLVVIVSSSRPAVAAPLPYQDQMPVDTIAAVGIVDTAAFWEKVQAWPLHQAVRQYLNTAGVTSNLDYQQFQLARKRLAQKLGYPVTLEEFFGVVFRDVAFFMTPPARSGEPPTMALVLGVQDETKARKLLEAIDDKLQRLSSAPSEPTSPTAGAERPSYTFEKLDIGGQTVSSYSKPSARGGHEAGYYTVAEQRLIYSNRRGGIEGLLRGAAPSDGKLMDNPSLNRLRATLPWGEADLVGWFDGDALLRFTRMAPMMSGMPGMSRSNKLAFTSRLVPDGMAAKVAVSNDPVEQSSHLQLSEALPAIGYISAKPVVATVYGLFDARTLYEEAQNFFSMFQLFGSMSAQGGSSHPLRRFEQSTGISLEQELVPALGQEVLFAINEFQVPQPRGTLGVPSLDMVIGLRVNDATKMQTVLEKLENYLVSQVGRLAMGGGEQGQGQVPQFQTVPHEKATIRTLPMGFPGVSPTLARHGEYVLISLNPESIRHSLERFEGKTLSIKSTPLFQELSQHIAPSDPRYTYNVVDFTALANAIRPVIPMLAYQMPQLNPTQLGNMLDLIVARIGTISSIMTRENGVPVEYVRVKMQ